MDALLQALTALRAQPNRVFELRIASDLVEPADTLLAINEARKTLRQALSGTMPSVGSVPVYVRAGARSTLRAF